LAIAQLRRARLSYGHGTTNARDEAIWLVLNGLKLPLTELITHLKRKVSATDQRRVLQLIEARIRQRVPAAYLTHEAWLGDFRFYVDPRVIVPRSFIAELLRENLAPWITHPARISQILDLCTGSGCLAILLAKTFPKTSVDAVDISTDALAVARRNVITYRLHRRIRLLQSDMFKALRGQRYDLIISNPPYVPTAAMRTLPVEYQREPALALAGGKDGFDFVRTILHTAAQHLTPNGLLVVEIGHYRKQLEAAYPRLPFIWPDTSAGDDCVFILERRDLLSLTAKQAASRRARPADPASRRR
jgi:ribosomal protein L3 glutamine methyltransferase